MKNSFLRSPLLVTALWALPAAMGMDFATRSASQMEALYLLDCAEDPTPHGYYGAFLQPCEFSFYEVSYPLFGAYVPPNRCLDPTSTLVGRPAPVNWFFNVTDHMSKNDWDSLNGQDFSVIADKLMLWPDQCVGVTPRCYAIDDIAIRDTLSRLFDQFPQGATHVQVNCQADALELSRVVFSFADGLEKSTPTIIAWMVTVLTLAIVALAWCGYGCLRLCCGEPRPTYAVVAAPVVGGHQYAAVEDGTAFPVQVKIV
jgi:hypothetical protein